MEGNEAQNLRSEEEAKFEVVKQKKEQLNEVLLKSKAEKDEMAKNLLKFEETTKIEKELLERKIVELEDVINGKEGSGLENQRLADDIENAK